MTWKKRQGAKRAARATHEIDASGQVVGRLATRIARLLVGKHKATYTPNIDEGDFVKVSHVERAEFTGKKWEQKVHFRTSNRPGGLKRAPVAKLRAENPSTTRGRVP